MRFWALLLLCGVLLTACGPGATGGASSASSDLDHVDANTSIEGTSASGDVSSAEKEPSGGYSSPAYISTIGKNGPGYDSDYPNYTGVDMEITLWRDGYDESTGIWGPMPSFFDEYPAVDSFPDSHQYTPEHPHGGFEGLEGDFVTTSWDGFTVKSHVAHESEHTSEGFFTIYSIITTREDIHSSRGIRIGSTLDEVWELYASEEMTDKETWTEMVEEFTEYGFCPEEYRGSLAPWISFHFEDGLVHEMELGYTASRRYEF